MTTDAIDMRYPIGKFARPAEFTASLRAEHIAALRELPEKMRQAVAGLNDAQLDTPYREGGWTVRQLVHHVADSHVMAYTRIKMALTEDWPAICNYQEAEWANLADSSLPVGVSLDLLAAVHTRWVALLESLSDADFEKGYVHPKGGQQKLALVLSIYAWHSLHHVAHVARLRERQGW